MENVLIKVLINARHQKSRYITQYTKLCLLLTIKILRN